MSALTPEEQAFVTERRESVLKRFDEVKSFIVNAQGTPGQRRPAAERMPAQEKVARLRYFTIDGGRQNVASLFKKDAAPATLGLEEGIGSVMWFGKRSGEAEVVP